MEERFNVITPPDRLIAWRVSRKRAIALTQDPSLIFRVEPAEPPRFRVKRAADRTHKWIVADRTRSHFFGAYATHELAMRAIDNRIRDERGMPHRLPITRAEAREALEAGRAPSAHIESAGNMHTLVVDEPFFPRVSMR